MLNQLTKQCLKLIPDFTKEIRVIDLMVPPSPHNANFILGLLTNHAHGRGYY